MSNCYDVIVIGGGVSGAFAALKIAESNKNIKTLMIESGRPSRKRRIQMCGFLGLLPSSDGKLYLNDLQSVEKIIGKIKTKTSFKWFKEIIDGIINLNIIKDNSPSINTIKKINKSEFKLQLNDYIQLYPSEIHNLSKYIADKLENKIECLFDTEVIGIKKEKKYFIIQTDNNQFEAKRILINVGRSGWLWAHELFKEFNIIEDNNYSQIGIRIEMPESLMSNFNGSNCSLIKKDFQIGPFQNNGTVIPEDLIDFVASSFRSNENRWKSDKVSFLLLNKKIFQNRGVEEANRLGSLAFILTQDRVCKEKISTLLAGKSKLSILPEFNWLPESIDDINLIIPDLISKGSFYYPTILPMTSKIKLKNNLESEDMPGLFVSGESAQITGLLGAIISGISVGKYLCE